MPKLYEPYLSDGIKFLFAYDDIDPTLLHIYARHLVNPHIAMQVWWEGETESWNTERERYETSDGRYVLYWLWLKKDKEVLVITCFRR